LLGVKCCSLFPLKNLSKVTPLKNSNLLLQAEHALYRSNAEITRNINASNGELLTLNENSKVWQDIEIIKNGTYKLL
jgi:hypothetical protein